jgi:RimJ/RimL family protein N-acetyltransferase
MKDANRPKLYFEKIDQDFLQLSRKWLGDKTFCGLIMAEPVEQSIQEAWFASLPDKKNYRIWGLKTSQWVGACGLKNIDKDRRMAEYWGYIYPIELRGVGLGREMFYFLAKQAADSGIDRLWLRVSKKNNAARISYQRWGFTTLEGEDPEITHMELSL